MYCATCQRRVERTGCVDLNEWPTEADSRRAWSPTAPVRAFVIGLVLLFAAPVLAEDFSRDEVEAVLGAPFDDYDPVDEGLFFLPPGSRVLLWITEDRPTWVTTQPARPGRYLTTIVVDSRGLVVEARQQLVGELDAPVLEVTKSLRSFLRTRRT
jgi:hypothetical protein